MLYRFSFLLIILFNYHVSACSAFFCNSDIKILAKNFDWYSGEGYLIKNLKGQEKYAYGFRSSNLAKWTSKFGSITFNQIGKEFPYGGINEKGLVVEQLWLSNSQYKDNNNKQISELEWIQYQLDNYATINEVIDNIDELTIKPNSTIHFILADITGDSAVIEFINGNVIITSKNENFQAVTNSSINESTLYFKKNKTLNTTSRNSLNRYCILKDNLKSKAVSVNEAFATLNLVKEDTEDYKTYWSIVYDINNLEIHFKSYDNKNIKTLTLSDFDFSKNGKVEYSLINSNKTEFKEYTAKLNENLLSLAMKMMNLKIDEKSANSHQMNPELINIDNVFQNNYADLTVKFQSQFEKGIIYFSIIRGEENFKSYSGFEIGTIPVSEEITKIILYNLPKGEFAIACFQDTNNDNKMDTKTFGIPKNTGFSNNKKKIFGIPPSYKTARMILDKSKTILIKIK